MDFDRIIDPFVERGNYIIDHWSEPCGAGWTVYFETALKASPVIFWALVGFDYLQVVRAFAKPERQMSRRRGKRRIGRIGGILGLGDVGNESGKRIPGARRLRGRQVSNGVQHLWQVDEFFQRVLWYYLLVDTAFEFGYQWTSLLYETGACRESLNGFAMWKGGNFGGPGGVGWIGVGGGELIESRQIAAGSDGACAAGFEPVKWFTSGELYNFNSDPVTWEIIIARNASGEEVLAGPVSATIPPLGTATLAIGMTMPPFQSGVALVRAIGGGSTSTVPGSGRTTKRIERKATLGPYADGTR